MLNEVIVEMRKMNKGADAGSEASFWSATDSTDIRRRVSFSREVSVNQYTGKSSTKQFQKFQYD